MTQIRWDLPSRQWDTTLVYRTKNKSKKISRVGLKSALFMSTKLHEVAWAKYIFWRCIMHEFEALMDAIRRLTDARRKAHGNDKEQARINAKLDKLYDIKWTMIMQRRASL